MNMFESFSPSEWRIRPAVLLIAAMLWCYSLNRAVVPLPDSLFQFLILLAACGYAWLYRNTGFSCTLTRSETGVFASMLALTVLSHLPGLGYSPGGDELYHAERAVFPLVQIERALHPGYAETSMEWLRGSLWRIFDLRHIAVLDLWRAISFLALVLILALLQIYRRHERRYPLLMNSGLLVILIAIIISGSTCALDADNHPPLRLLPLTLSAGLFGLNSFAFRFPSVLAATVASFLFYRTMRRDHPQQPAWWSYVVSLLVSYIPVVFYVAEAVEPSVFGYLTYVIVLLSILTSIRRHDSEYLIQAGVFAALGVLLRQPTLVLWLPITIATIFSGRLRDIPFLAKVFSPGLICIPYLLTARAIGHVAMPEGQSLVGHLMTAAENGSMLMTTLNSTTVPWAFFGIACGIFALIRAPRKEMLLFLLVVPAFVLFFSIWAYLWGLGRYQAEYVAPFLALAIVLAASYSGSRTRRVVTFLFPALVATTIELNSNFSLDTNYAEWPRMRVTSTANFPYRDALGQLKRRESEGRFVILGGSPWYNAMPLWISGFSYRESAIWSEKQGAFREFLKTNADTRAMREFFMKNEIHYLVVQSGTRRESQHRSPEVAHAIERIERVGLEQRSFFYKLFSVSGEHGGILDVYAPKE